MENEGVEEFDEIDAGEDEPSLLEIFQAEMTPEFVEQLQVWYVLGHGAYNIVVRTQRDTALRVSYVADGNTSQHEQLARANAIALRLASERLRVALGPALSATAMHELVAVKYLPDSLTDALRPQPDVPDVIKRGKADVGFHFWVSEMAYIGDVTLLSAYENPLTPTQLLQTAFCLCWTLFVTESLIGLAHRDIKPENIVMRRFKEPAALRFVSGTEEAFVLRDVTHVPIMIDYDFSMTAITTPKHRNRLSGTPKWLSPEYIMSSIFGYEYPNAYGTDWWALGAMFFELLTFPAFRDTVFDGSFQCLPYRVRVMQAATKAGFSHIKALTFFLPIIGTHCLVNAIVGNGLAPPAECFISPRQYGLWQILYGHEPMMELTPFLQSKRYLQLHAAYYADKTPEADRLRMFIKQALTWVPDHRTYGLMTFRHLFSAAFRPFQVANFNGQRLPNDAICPVQPAMPTIFVAIWYQHVFAELQEYRLMENHLKEEEN
jgi:hypothetical protein